MEEIIHPFPPVYDERSEILILGSFPSVKSREEGFYYGNPQNRFWKLLSAIFGESAGSIEEKKSLLLSHRIALWDSIASCRIQGSSDSSITGIVPNLIPELIAETHISRILANGSKAYEAYMRHIYRPGMPIPVKLPSTSPANAAWPLERLIEAWKPELCKKTAADDILSP